MTRAVILRAVPAQEPPRSPLAWWEWANTPCSYDVGRILAAEYAVVVDADGDIRDLRRLIGLTRSHQGLIQLQAVPTADVQAATVPEVTTPVTYTELPNLPVSYRRTPAELDDLAHHWDQWERRYSDNPHLFGDAAPAWIRQQLEALPPASTVLELGAGQGRLALELAQSGHRVTAVDMSSTATQRLKSTADARGLSLQIITGDALRWLDAQHSQHWDVAVMQCFSAGSRPATTAVLRLLADRATSLVMENATVVTTADDVYQAWSAQATVVTTAGEVPLTRVRL